MHSWNNSIFKTIFKNKNGFLRSGWTILIVMLLYYALLYFASFLVLTALIVILTATGDLNRAADYFSPLANWVNDACLPVAMLILTDVMMIIIPIIAWKCFFSAMGAFLYHGIRFFFLLTFYCFMAATNRFVISPGLVMAVPATAARTPLLRSNTLYCGLLPLILTVPPYSLNISSSSAWYLSFILLISSLRPSSSESW